MSDDKPRDEYSRQNPLPPPERVKVTSPILENAGEPGGPHTPGAKAKRRKKKKKEK